MVCSSLSRLGLTAAHRNFGLAYVLLGPVGAWQMGASIYRMGHKWSGLPPLMLSAVGLLGALTGTLYWLFATRGDVEATISPVQQGSPPALAHGPAFSS